MAATPIVSTLDSVLTSLPAIRLGRFRLPRCLSVTAALVAACLSAPATAQTSDLRGIAYTSGTSAVQQSYTNVEFATISGIHAVDTAGNKSAATGTLATPTGQITHAVFSVDVRDRLP